MPARVALGSTDVTIPLVPLAERGPPFSFGNCSVGAGGDTAEDGVGAFRLGVVDAAMLGFELLGSGAVDTVFWGQAVAFSAARQIQAGDNRLIRIRNSQHSLLAALCARLGP